MRRELADALKEKHEAQEWWHGQPPRHPELPGQPCSTNNPPPQQAEPYGTPTSEAVPRAGLQQESTDLQIARQQAETYQRAASVARMDFVRETRAHARLQESQAEMTCALDHWLRQQGFNPRKVKIDMMQMWQLPPTPTAFQAGPGPSGLPDATER